MRGEYYFLLYTLHYGVELPPRARRIRCSRRGRARRRGTTSACAENTAAHQDISRCLRNYLRVRGEYRGMCPWRIRRPELPPRARRILISETITQAPGGTTSACAENTYTGGHCAEHSGNYLRVRGEYSIQIVGSCRVMELPPRARRIRPRLPPWPVAHGTTSACAENTHLSGHEPS